MAQPRQGPEVPGLALQDRPVHAGGLLPPAEVAVGAPRRQVGVQAAGGLVQLFLEGPHPGGAPVQLGEAVQQDPRLLHAPPGGLEVGQAVVRLGPVRVDLQGPAQHLLGRVVAFRVGVEHPEFPAGFPVGGSEPDGALQHLLRLRRAPLQPQEPSQARQRPGIGRVGRHGPQQGCLGPVVRPPLLVQTRQEPVRGSRSRIDAHGLFQQGHRFRVASLLPVGHGQIVAGADEGGIQPKGGQVRGPGRVPAPQLHVGGGQIVVGFGGEGVQGQRLSIRGQCVAVPGLAVQAVPEGAKPLYLRIRRRRLGCLAGARPDRHQGDRGGAKQGCKRRCNRAGLRLDQRLQVPPSRGPMDWMGQRVEWVSRAEAPRLVLASSASSMCSHPATPGFDPRALRRLSHGGAQGRRYPWRISAPSAGFP